MQKMHFPGAIDLFQGAAFKPVQIVPAILSDDRCVEIPHRKGVVAKDLDSLEIKPICPAKPIRLGRANLLLGVIQVPILAMLEEIIAFGCMGFERLQIMLREAVVKPPQGGLNSLQIAFVANEGLLFLVSFGMHLS